MAPPLVANALVTYSVNNSAFGIFSPATATTDVNGVAQTTFIAKTRSGTAIITATITSSDQYGSHTEILNLDQKIDHDIPQNAEFDNPAQLPVGTVDNLTVTITDAYGNRVDNLGPNPATRHNFNLYMPGGDERGLWDGSAFASQAEAETDSHGNATIRYRIANTAQMNMVYMDVIGNMVSAPDTWIEGIGLNVPFFIVQESPIPTNDTYADGIQQIGLYYYIYDQYMNPMNSTPVHIAASDGTYSDQLTNTLGAVFLTFGPKDTAGVYTITATAVDNASTTAGAYCLNTGTRGNCEQDLVFHNTEPVDMIVNANPLSMTSLDVNPNSRGVIQARVVDAKGNSVIGQNVSFTLGTPTYDYPYSGVTAPSISATSAKTATGGFATSTFTPGAFATAGAEYNNTATGTVIVTVRWTNPSGTITQTKDVTFTWKNYPYLSIRVPPDMCEDVKVGDKINMSVTIVGDGAALRPKPIDVVLVTDCSGSMAGSKITAAKTAGKIFAASMSDQDRVGLESYGWDAPSSPWNSRARNDLPLTFISAATRTTVNTTIDAYYSDDYTPTRPAIYNASLLIVDDALQRPQAVKAILLMTDGLWNYGGDPRGASTSYTRMPFEGAHPVAASESVVTFAKTNGIRLYTVGLGSNVDTAELQAYATETGGKYYPAPSASDLVSVYQQIAGDLQETAGGSTVVSLDFGTVNINENPSSNIGAYMQYVRDTPAGGPYITDSTYVNKTNMAVNGSMYWYTGYPISVDNSGDWPNAMNFNVGEVKLNDTWSASFRLNLTQAGKIELFVPASNTKICFTDAATGATMCQRPDPVSCNIQQQRVDVPFGNKNITLNNPTQSISSSNPNIFTIGWNLTYDGEKSVQQTVQFQNTGTNAPPATVPGGILFENAVNEKLEHFTIDATNWAPGTYRISVDAVAVDAKRPTPLTYIFVKQAPTEKKYIKLE